MKVRVPVHARTFLFLAPFVVMLIVHRALGLADNLLVPPEAGEPNAALYNLVMALVLWGGIAGFWFHTIWHASESTVWVVAKAAVVATIFAAMVYMSGLPSS